VKPAKLLSWLPGLLALAIVLATAVPAGPTRGFDLEAFGGIPVLEGGRIKPLDSVARNALLMIRGKQSFPFKGRMVGPDEWILDVLFRPRVADTQPVFVINDPDVLGLMGVKQTSNRYFDFNTLAPHLQEVEDQARAAEALEAVQRSRFQNAVLNLFQRVVLYDQLENTIQLADSPGLFMELQALGTSEVARRQRSLAEAARFRPLPPLPGQGPDAWQNTGEALAAALASGQTHPGLAALAWVGASYAADDPGSFNRGVAELHRASGSLSPGALRHAGSEILFNRVQPFYLGMVIYVLALLVVFASWLWRPDLLQPAAFSLLAAGAAVHTAGLVSRILLQGRPPVTNLYSSAVFVGWAAVVLGLLLERIYRKGFGTAVAAAAGFGSLIVAHHLAMEGDTMEMMRAVLDSNFWLGTHVVTVTIGYSGTFLAGIIAIAYTLRKHLAPAPDPAATRVLVDMTYGIICFALLFSFVGTVLGGIWADQSWGRFWGWDPKENGALLIVLWNAIILHCRWGDFIREKGIMAMAIFGNIITSLSWFGVNMLGIGLHSYGFMDQAFWALSAFIATQAVLIVLCLSPRRFRPIRSSPSE
jgi:ABC-type transport system involved in cytochrome c biogenesis permease subunit